MDIFLIVISCVIALLLLGVNIYVLALYCHRILCFLFIKASDSGFGASLYCKILVVLGFTLAWG